MRSKWSRKARDHARKLSANGLAIPEIAALMGRSPRSVARQLSSHEVPRPINHYCQRRPYYNRVEISSMLGMGIDEFLQHQVELEEDHSMPRSTRARYSVPRPAFDRWLQKREYPDLTPLEWAWKARGAFLRACADRHSDHEINRAARILRAAESVLLQQKYSDG